MQRSNASHIKVMGSAAVLLIALTGCSGGGGSANAGETRDSSKPAAVENADAQIKAIQDNPHMPEVAKSAAIATIRQHQNEGSHHVSK